MLQAVQRAELEALLQAAVTPSPSGSLPTPHSTEPSTPLPECCSSVSGVAVILRSESTPLHPPSDTARGDRRFRQANQKGRVEYWGNLLGYIDAAYRKKFGRHYPWNNLARKNLWNLARVHSTWRVMALWDLYLETDSWWAWGTGWSVYGMIRDTGRLMDESRFKHLADEHEGNLERGGKKQLGPRACTSPPTLPMIAPMGKRKAIHTLGSPGIRPIRLGSREIGSAQGPEHVRSHANSYDRFLASRLC